MSNFSSAVQLYLKEIRQGLGHVPRFDMSNSVKHASRLREVHLEWERQIAQAHHFEISSEAAEMIGTVVSNMGPSVIEMFRRTPLIFDDIWLEIGAEGGAEEYGALIKRTHATTTCHIFFRINGEINPCFQALHMENTLSEPSKTILTPAGEYVMQIERNAADWHPIFDLQAQSARAMTGLAFGMSVLLQHKGMLDIEDGGTVVSRAERRRMKRGGEPQSSDLPTKRINRIKLGEYGHAQREAMESDARGRGSKRAHWVRGHFFLARNNQMTWRMPHVRGVGPVIKQQRIVEADLANRLAS